MWVWNKLNECFVPQKSTYSVIGCLNLQFFIKSFLAVPIYYQCKLSHGSLLRKIQILFKYKLSLLPSSPSKNKARRWWVSQKKILLKKTDLILGLTFRISCYSTGSATDALFCLITGHGKTAASASIPSKYQTIVSDNSERKGFLSRSKRFEGMNVVCTVIQVLLPCKA